MGGFTSLVATGTLTANVGAVNAAAGLTMFGTDAASVFAGGFVYGMGNLFAATAGTLAKSATRIAYGDDPKEAIQDAPRDILIAPVEGVASSMVTTTGGGVIASEVASQIPSAAYSIYEVLDNLPEDEKQDRDDDEKKKKRRL